MGRAGARALLSAAAIALGLLAALAGERLFVAQVQAPACRSYAERLGVAHAEALVVERVTVATGQSRAHSCLMADPRTGARAAIDFAPADIPYAADTLQALAMALPFAATSIGAWLAAAAAARRLGWPLDQP